jgi:hypothetical protein
MSVLRYFLSVPLGDDYPEAYADSPMRDPVDNAREIIYSAPAFDTAADIVAELRSPMGAEYTVTERIPAHDIDGETFTQEWVFNVYADGTAIFQCLEQGGETHRSESIPDDVIADVERAGFTVTNT